MLITDSRLESALKKLAESDLIIAKLHADAERAEFRAKATKDAIFLRETGSVAERSAKAGVHPEYEQAMEHYFKAIQAHEGLRNVRSREVIIIECWRSMNSARTKGLLT